MLQKVKNLAKILITFRDQNNLRYNIKCRKHLFKQYILTSVQCNSLSKLSPPDGKRRIVSTNNDIEFQD